jgi:hypothetical protein
MEQWEYRYIVADRDEIFKVNDTLIERSSLPSYLDKVGKEGWELVGICDEGAAGYWRLIFKRPMHTRDVQQSHVALIVRNITHLVSQQNRIADILSKRIKK